MTFKELAEKDLGQTFINPDEFGETHKINGKPAEIVIDNDRLLQRSKKEFDGISIGEVLYYVKKSDFGEKPEQGTPQNFDGRTMYVFDAREDSGLYEIILHQNRGG
jgi:hypothetical protein